MNVYVDHKQVYGMSCTKASKQRGMMNTAGVHVGTVEQHVLTIRYNIVGVDHVYVRMRSFPAIICIDSY